jgi:hypothetical protein
MEILRPLQNEDIPKIDEIYQRCHKGQFNVPNQLVNTVYASVVVDGEKLIAYGTVKLIGEAVLVLDSSLPAGPKVRAMQSLFTEGVNVCRANGLETLCVFSNKPEFLKLLKRHYGFKDSYPAIALSLE